MRDVAVKRCIQDDRRRNPHFVHRIVSRCRRDIFVAVFGLSLAAICLDYSLAPILNTLTPALSCGFLVLLLIRRLSAEAGARPSIPGIASLIARWRILCFFVLHLTGIVAVLTLHNTGGVVHATSNWLLAAAKYLVLLPTAILLPWLGWRDFDRKYRAEWLAAAIVLVSFYPYRIFTMAWPWYGQILGRSVYALSHLFVSSIRYVPDVFPTLIGPNLDVTILFWCGGLLGVKLFQMLFGLVLIVDWNVLNRRRAVAAYLGGLTVMLCGNALRIGLIFVLGNTAFERPVIEYHITAGWIFFTLVSLVYLFPVYPWLLGGAGGGRSKQDSHGSKLVARRPLLRPHRPPMKSS